MELQNPLITIITPTFNAGKFIDECIKSVASQTFTNYEHIIVDSVSSDNTIDIVKKHQFTKRNLKLIVEKDSGVYDAMNKGIGLAKSEWLYFLGADDTFYNTDVLQQISQAITNTTSQIIYGNVYFKKLKRFYDGKFNIEKMLTHNICHQAIFYQNSVFKTIGEYSLRYRLEADYDLNLRCWLNADIKYTYVDLIIANFEDGGLSSSKNDSIFIEDYPSKIISLILSSNRGLIFKTKYLSIAYRKILQRYPLSYLFNTFLNKESFFYKLLAIIWMFLSLPFYAGKKFLQLQKIN